MSQLQGNLDKGIRTGAALLDEALAKITEGENVAVHIVSESPCNCQRMVDDPLALEEMQRRHAWLNICSSLTTYFEHCS